jgi:ubiquinone/menaquinone biosynthesis C-methylase UbiE
VTTPSYRTFTGSAAETYQRFFVPAIAMPVSVPLLDVAKLQAGERVLDVACGTGVIARRAAEQVGPTGSVTGVDLSPDMIDVAKGVEAPDGAHVEWHVGDAAALPLPDATYDVVLCQMGLMFVEDRPAALTEMRRVLGSGGRAVVSTPGPIQPVFQILESSIEEHIDPSLGRFVAGVFSMHDADEVSALLTSAGFTAVTATTVPVELRLPSPADWLWQYVNLTPIGPLVAAADPQAQAALERHVVEAWQPYVARGRLRVHQPMVIASGRR